MKYLFDTDHLSILQRQTGPSYVALQARLAQHPQNDFACSIISFHEQVLGCNAYVSQARNSYEVVRGYDMLAQVLRDFLDIPVLPFDAAAQQLFEQWRAQRVRIQTMDLRIAACAASAGLTILTRNARDFGKVPALSFEDWTH
ncbi:MAG: type II toxin-antitoxin system VapC family toxin [Acidobacteria bacterium]|nr:type II toxin-antitoxin system VapC family toxin [Acidobacteriota bacterium]